MVALRKKLTGEMLIRNGWIYVGGMYVLKNEPVRFGWNPNTFETIAGFTTVPFGIEYVYQMKRLLKGFGIKRKIK